MDITSLLSVFIFTKDRHEYLKQNIAWHTRKSLNYKIYVMDASNNEFESLEQNRENLTYLHMPGASFFERTRKLEAVLCTEYFVICADDDFLLPSALVETTKYLTTNSDKNIVSAQGRYLLFDNDNLYPYKIYKHTYSAFDGLRVQDSTNLQRMLNLNSYPIFHYCYSICKKEVIQKFNKISKNLEKYDQNGVLHHALFEPLMGFAVAIVGEYVSLNNAYCVRRTSMPWKSIEVEVYFCDKKYADIQNLIIDNLCMLDDFKSNKIEISKGYLRAVLDSYCINAQKRRLFKVERNIGHNSKEVTSLIKLVGRRIYYKINSLVNFFGVGRDYFDFSEVVYDIAKNDILELENFLKKIQSSNSKVRSESRI